ncbi:MAG TPA: hypothetical protein VFT62_10355 [Mycobacteriales bacterium]|nr:hypothetical protein [Mycobacteriales bacterium]
MSLQQRIEKSSAGQTVLSVVILALIAGVLAWNLPSSQLATDGRNWAQPMVHVLGLDQAWGVFSPNPRGESIDLRAVVELRDGSQVVWHPPSRGHVLEPYRSYRWWKWVENVRSNESEAYWYQTALWVAHKYENLAPVSVTLVRRWRESTPPGTSEVDHWHSYAFYTLDVARGSR